MRRLARWTLNALTVLSLLLCVAAVVLGVTSRRHPRIWAEWGHYSAVGIAGGKLFFSRATQKVFVSSANAPIPKVREWVLLGCGAYRTTFSPGQVVWGISVPFWLIAMACAAPPTFVALRFQKTRRTRRRARGWQCTACGYDLTGNVSGVCPECGTKIAELPA